jgi:nucleoside-diphosphate-sugar epimerase
LIGCGDIGSSLGLRLVSQGVSALGLRRDIAKLPTDLPGLSLDYSSDHMSCLRDWDGDIAVITPTPAAMSEQGYQSGYLAPVQQFIAACGNRPRQVLFVSSTRVYGDQDGAWVDEKTSPRPSGYAGEIILQAEKSLRDSCHQVVVARPGGIYGRWPSRLLQRIERGELRDRLPQQYGNRIHRDDCVGMLWHLLQGMLAGEKLEPGYLLVDDAPVSQWEVEQWLAQQLQVSEKSSAGVGQPGTGGSKRCRNHRLHRSGYKLIYPDYRAGYGAMLANR